MPKGRWILGYGGDFALEMRDRASTPRAILDAAFPDHPAIIMDYTSHAQFVNSAAYALARIHRDTPDGIIRMSDARSSSHSFASWRRGSSGRD